MAKVRVRKDNGLLFLDFYYRASRKTPPSFATGCTMLTVA